MSITIEKVKKCEWVNEIELLLLKQGRKMTNLKKVDNNKLQTIYIDLCKKYNIDYNEEAFLKSIVEERNEKKRIMKDTKILKLKMEKEQNDKKVLALKETNDYIDMLIKSNKCKEYLESVENELIREHNKSKEEQIEVYKSKDNDYWVEQLDKYEKAKERAFRERELMFKNYSQVHKNLKLEDIVINEDYDTLNCKLNGINIEVCLMNEIIKPTLEERLKHIQKIYSSYLETDTLYPLIREMLKSGKYDRGDMMRIVNGGFLNKEF